MKVVAVIDEPFARSTVLAILGRSGCQVQSATGAAEVVERALQDPPDVLVVDWFLDDIDGISLVREIRRRLGRQVGVVLVAPLAEPAARAYALKAGADEYVTRPFADDELTKAVKSCAIRSHAVLSGAFNPLQRGLFGLLFWSQFEVQARGALADFCGLPVEAHPACPAGTEPPRITASLGMLDISHLLEVHVVISCSRITGARLARPVLRSASIDEPEIKEMLSELCNIILGQAKTSFRAGGFRFILSLPTDHGAAEAFPSSKRVWLTGGFGTACVTLGARVAQSMLVRAADLRENMVLAEDVKTDAGEMLFKAGTRLTTSALDRVVRHLALRQVRVAMVGQ